MAEGPKVVSGLAEFQSLVKGGRFDEAFDLYFGWLGNRLRQEGRHREDLNAILQLLPAGEPALDENKVGWANLLAGMAYLNNGRPRAALRHLARAYPPPNRRARLSMRGPRLLLSAQCAVLLGDLKGARDQVVEITSDSSYATGHRISSNLVMSHVALLMGETSIASTAILHATRLIDDAKEDFSGFRPSLIWGQALFERFAAASDRLGEFATRLLAEEDVQYKYKGHLLLASVFRKRGDFAEAEAEANQAAMHLLGNEETYRFGNLMIERAKLAVAQRSFAGARSAADEALRCAEAGGLLPIRIEAELLLSEAAFGLNEVEPGRTFLDSARLRLAGRPLDATFAALGRRLASAGAVDNADGSRAVAHDTLSTAVLGPPKTWDVFVSHASEDKELVAVPLVRALEQRGMRVWYDASVLQIGDRLREKVEEGLRNSSAAVVILSQDFFRKQWTRMELDGLLSLEQATGKKILPVWHSLEQDEVARYSPILAGRVAGRTSEGIDNLANRLTQVITGVPGADRSPAATDAVLELDEDLHVIGGFDAVRAFVSEVRYSSERFVKAAFKIQLRALTSLRSKLLELDRKGELTPSDRIVRVKLQRERDEYEARELGVTRAVSILQEHRARFKAYISHDAEFATTLWALIKLFQEGSLVPEDSGGYRFDIMFQDGGTIGGRILLTKEESERFQASLGAENIFLIRRGGYEPTVDELPNNIVISQVIPTIVFGLVNAEVDREQIAAYLDLSRWTCGLA